MAEILVSQRKTSMRICVLVSSYDDSGSAEIFRDVGDTYQDPSLYVTSHSFTLQVLSKEGAIEQLKTIVTEGYDFIWSFLWGTGDSEYADVAGIEAVKFLESTGHPMLGTSSRYLSITKEDVKKAAALLGTFKVPNWSLVRENMDFHAEGLDYPLIVKPTHSLGSLNMTQKSVVSSKTELEEQISWLRSKIRPHETILVEEFISGEEVSVMVLETKDGTIALHPLVYTFPEGTKETERWLDFENKFAAVEADVITYKLWDGDEGVMEKIKEAGIAAFESLGVLGSGYARVDCRVRGNEVYVLEVNHTPAFFAALGNKYGDDFVIQETFPGGHAALVDTIIDSRQRFDFQEGRFTRFASTYEAYASGPNVEMFGVWGEIVAANDFSGTVLDLGCGTGKIGNMILAKEPKSRSQLYGIDVSPEMAGRAVAYAKVHIGLLENVMLDQERMAGGFDHVLAVGVFPYVEHGHFKLVLGRCFDLARKSVTLTVEKIEESFKENSVALDPANIIFNHVQIVKEFGAPGGWKLVWKREDYLWISPSTQDPVYGVTFRWERSTERCAGDA